MKHQKISLFLSAAVAALALGLTAPASAVTFTITYGDGPSEGFNDPVLGAERRAALEFALDIWAVRLDGDVNIRVSAQFNPLGGDQFGATLGFAGPSSNHRNFAGSQANTVYPVALANQIAGTDLNGATSEIQCTFNTSVDNSTVLGNNDFYYGLDLNAGSDTHFVTVALHEIGHGLGFLDNMDSNGSYVSFGQPSIYDRQLVRPGQGNIVDLSQSERADQLISGFLFFQGPESLATRPNGFRMYTPNPFEPGSSVSHFDLTLTPDELMEPQFNVPIIEPNFELPVFDDLGYNILGPPTAAETSWNLYE
jgi:hypothetical protein